MNRLRQSSRSALACRILLVLLPLVAVSAAWQRPGTPFLVLLLVLAGLWALLPESSAGIVVLLLVISWWAAAVRDPLGVRVLLAATALLAAHIAAVLASYGPARLPIDGRLASLWLLRGVAASAAALLAWAVATWLAGSGPQPALWSIALLGVAGAVVSASVLLRDTSSD
ncbi:conserved membrane hypothetical protein [metagenome]|uniref:Uncharacterized protein n=1 Tax=metagenome TaxID=256318 RepID=A0A2P2CE20_9ZZZZ